MNIKRAKEVLRNMRPKIVTDDLASTLKTEEETIAIDFALKAIDFYLRQRADIEIMKTLNPQITISTASANKEVINCENCKYSRFVEWKDDMPFECCKGEYLGVYEFHERDWFCADGKERDK